MTRHRDSKTTPSWAKNGPFLHGAPRVLGGGMISPCLIVANAQNYDST